MYFDNDDKLKAFLKKESARLGISINNTYNTYFSKILLERISAMSYDELLVKGSFSELAHLNEMTRPITDIDLVSTKYHNDPLLILFRAMCDTNEDLYYELTSLPKQTKTGIYKIHIEANYGKIRHPISIDFQELSNTVYEKTCKIVSPVFKNDLPFSIWTPSYEEHLAEKLCIVLESNKENVINTRVKDFYDIYKLCGGEYDLEKLSSYFSRMLKERGKIDVRNVSIKHLNKNYIEQHKSTWDSMNLKYEFLDKSLEFEESVEFTKKILAKEIEKLKF